MKRPSWKAITALLAVAGIAGLTLAGCSDSSQTNTPTQPTNETPTPTITSTPIATQKPQGQPKPTEINLLPYVLATVAVAVIAFVAGVLLTLRIKKSKTK